MEQPAHLIIVDGPEAGRSISIPESGARLGRVSENDITFQDPSMSRFQCRMFFKNGKLWVSDLGSTNKTLVNNRGVQEQALHVGDMLTLGQTQIKVSFAGEEIAGAAAAPAAEAPAAEAPAAAAPAAAAPAAAAPAAAAPAAEAPAAAAEVPESDAVVINEDGAIDLGLKPEAEVPQQKRKDRDEGAGKATKLLWFAVLMLALIAGGLVLVTQLLPDPNAGSGEGEGSGGSDKKPERLEVYYEEIKADPDNIERYQIELRGGILNMTLDNIANSLHHRHDPATVDVQTIELLKNQLVATGFFDLQPEYNSIATDVYNVLNVTLVVGGKLHQCQVRNASLPKAMRETRDLLVSFAETETGVVGWNLSPEEKMELARTRFDNARKLEHEMLVNYGNLWRAITEYRGVEAILAGMDPVPEIYRESVLKVEELTEKLDEQVQDLKYEAEQAVRLEQWAAAARALRAIKEQIPDRGHTTHRWADRALIDVERKL